MAGHSHSSNIKHRKNAQDNKRAKIFTRIQREVYNAAKNGGEDQNFNPRLRLAILRGKAANMPKDKIEAAISKAVSPNSSSCFEEMTYLAHVSGGIALLVDCLTDNKNRCIAEVRSVITKYAGTTGDSSAISFLFSKIGVILYKFDRVSNSDSILEVLIETMPNSIEIISIPSDEDEEKEDKFHKITCEVLDFNKIKESLAGEFGEPDIFEIQWTPNTPLENVPEDNIEKTNAIINALEAFDDVNSVYSNI